jgi:hypothetical protein
MRQKTLTYGGLAAGELARPHPQLDSPSVFVAMVESVSA